MNITDEAEKNLKQRSGYTWNLKEDPVYTCDDLKLLSIRMDNNLRDAQSIYNTIKDMNNSDTFVPGYNLFNAQFVMDWQDGLNKVSITQNEEL